MSVADDYGFSQVHDRLLRYLRRCISGEDHPFALPDIPCYLNELLACEDFYGGIEPRIGGKHMRVIAIDGFPEDELAWHSRELDNLPIEYRWSTRAILIDPDEARSMLDMHRKKWRSKSPRMEGSNLQNADRSHQHLCAANGDGRGRSDGRRCIR